MVKFDGSDSLYSAWKHLEKGRLKAREKKSTKGAGYEKDLEILDEYVAFCVKSLNDFFLTAKMSFGTSHWDVEDATPSELLRPTSINGLIACLRRVISHNMSLSPEFHKKRMSFSAFKFGAYKSSRWDALGETLFAEHYKGSGS